MSTATLPGVCREVFWATCWTEFQAAAYSSVSSRWGNEVAATPRLYLVVFQLELSSDAHIQSLHVTTLIHAQSRTISLKSALSWVLSLPSLNSLQMNCFCLPLPQVLRDMCKQGYRDALHFLKKNGKALSVCGVCWIVSWVPGFVTWPWG